MNISEDDEWICDTCGLLLLEDGYGWYCAHCEELYGEKLYEKKAVRPKGQTPTS